MTDWGYKSPMEDIRRLYAENCTSCKDKRGTPCRFKGCKINKQMRRLFKEEEKRANQFADGVVRTQKFNNCPVGYRKK